MVRMGRLEIRSQGDGETRVIGLVGELDADGCPAVEEELAQAEAEESGLIVIDMSLLRFIDSTGIGLIVAALRRSEEDSQRLRFLPSRSEDVQRLLEICGLEPRLPYLES